MTLPEELRAAVADLAGYDVVERAMARGRRRRRGAAVAALLAVLAVLGSVSLVVVIPQVSDARVAAPTAGASIPEHVGRAGLFPRGAADSPAGPASVIVSSNAPSSPFGGDDVVVIGAQQDTYRVIDTAADAGWDAVLSPSGDRVAYTTGHAVAVVDLVHGDIRTYRPADNRVDRFAPEVWLPDGRGLVVVSRTEADDPTTQGIVTQLSILDLASGGLTPFAEATWDIATPGWAVAVSPDGQRIAYHYANFLSVFDRRTGAKTRFDLDGYRALAGRAAWAPDGSLTLVHEDWQTSRDTFELLLVDPTDGTYRATAAVVRGFRMIRLIGWSGTTPVVVGYGDGACSALDGWSEVFSPRESTCPVGVYLISDGVQRVLVQPAPEIYSIDVAEDLLANPVSRTGHPPASPPTWAWIVLIVLGFLSLATFLALRLNRPPTRMVR